MRSVPTIDVSGALNGAGGGGGPGGAGGAGGAGPARADEAARAIDAACADSGFFIVTGHGVGAELVGEVMGAARRFFLLPAEAKQKVAPPGPPHYRGWLGLDTTSLAATLGDDETPPDLCESFNVGRFDDPEIRARAFVEGAEATFLPNLWPEEPAELRRTFERY